MAMKKIDLEACYDRYNVRMREARSMEKAGRYQQAIERASSALEHVDGMMQYEQRYGGGEFTSIAAIDLILRYAPLLFDHASLDNLAKLLKDSRRIERDTSADMGDKMARAGKLMWACHRLWGCLESNPGARQDELRQQLGGEQDEWRAIVQGWERMGLLQRIPEGGSYRLAFCTLMEEVVAGKCPSCGNTTQGPKISFLERTTCANCNATGLFVILTSNTPTDVRD